MTQNKSKKYVLDTNILLQSPSSILGFKDNEVIVTSTTLQELDKKKGLPGETGYHAREAIRNIESLKTCTDVYYDKGILLPDGGLFRIVTDSRKNILPLGYALDLPDNRIINTALHLGDDTVLITNDISMRINAEICGLKAESYRNEEIECLEDYLGRREVTVYSKKEVDDIASTMLENEFILIHQGTNSRLAIKKDSKLVTIKDAEYKTNYCSPLNVVQKFALYALLAPADKLPLVILKGPAGTAKTFLSLAAGLTGQNSPNGYDKLMVTRTNTLSDAELGFLPGNLEEKMGPLVLPFIDNLQVLLKQEHENIKDEGEQVNTKIANMFKDGTIEVCSVAYMRGRSLIDSFVIIDEAQNATIGQILEIVTRAGKNTKIVICGDPDQIDNPKLDKKNNGLVFASERMKGSSLCAQVSFSHDETVRSNLATEAALRLKP